MNTGLNFKIEYTHTHTHYFDSFFICKETKGNTSEETTVHIAARNLLNEAVARVVKNELNKMLRVKMRELKLPLEVKMS
jgi:hypothetical protein